MQITQVLSKKLDQAKLTMSEVELKQFEAKEVEELATRYGDRVGKVRFFFEFFLLCNVAMWKYSNVIYVHFSLSCL